MTASHPVSRVLTRWRSSSFSFSRALSFSRSSSFCSCGCDDGTRPMPERSCLFSSSSSATRRSRYVNCALRRSREFWAAMRLRCARASLRSSGVTSERERLREGPARASDVCASGEGASSMGEAGSAKSMSAGRFMIDEVGVVRMKSWRGVRGVNRIRRDGSCRRADCLKALREYVVVVGKAVRTRTDTYLSSVVGYLALPFLALFIHVSTTLRPLRFLHVRVQVSDPSLSDSCCARSLARHGQERQGTGPRSQLSRRPKQRHHTTHQLSLPGQLVPWLDISSRQPRRSGSRG